MYDLNEILIQSVKERASDIHLTSGRAPSYRVDGVLAPIMGERLTPQMLEDILLPLIDKRHREELEETGQTDFAYAISGVGRFRVNVFKQRGTLAAVMRSLPFNIPEPEDLGIPREVVEMTSRKRGLVLVTGPTGSGKSTTLAAMIDHINETRSDHIITIEDPIEYVYRGKQALIHQREVGADVPSFASALRSALREDPDVILVGEMRDYETISAAVTAAETGHLVMSTLHTIGAAQTIDRIIDVCPAGAQNQIRGQLAAVLRGVITQQLLPLADGQGRCAATEILVGTDAVANLIREGKCYQIPSILQSGAALGMHSLNADLARLVATGRITREAAERCATDKSDLRNYL